MKLKWIGGLIRGSSMAQITTHQQQNQAWLGLALGIFALGLSGCQTTNKGLDTSGYQTMTQPSESRGRNRQEVARVRTSLAAQYIRENKLDAAQRQLEMAFAAESRYAPAYDMMGILLQQEGSPSNLRRADEYFQRAISLDSDFVQARNNYGVYLVQMKRYPEAIKQFEIAGSTLGYEGRISALENLGKTYLQLKDEKSATQAFLRALEGNRSSIVAHVELVDLLLKQKRTGRAIQMYEETLMLMQGQPLDPRMLMQGIRIATLQNQFDKRQKLAQELLATYPLSPEAKTLRNWLKNPRSPSSWK